MLSSKNVLQSVWNITTDNFLFVQPILFYSIPFYSILVTATECIFRYLLIIRTSVLNRMIVLPALFSSSPICPHNFSFQTLSLYSYFFTHLRTNTINFSSISEEKPGSTRCKQTLEAYWRRRSWISEWESSRFPDWLGPVPSRQTFSLSKGDGTELRLDGDVPVSVNISV